MTISTAASELAAQVSNYTDAKAPEFWVDSFPGDSDDAKVGAAMIAAMPAKGTVRFGPRTYSCAMRWDFDGCFPLGTSGTIIQATTPSAAIRIGKPSGAAPGNYDIQPMVGNFRFDGNGIADGSANDGYAFLTNAVSVTYLSIAIDHLAPVCDGIGVQGQNNVFINCDAAAGAPGFCMVFDYGCGGNTVLGGNPTGGNIIDFRQSGITAAGYVQPQNNLIENVVTDHRAGVDSLTTGKYCIRHSAGWLNVIRNINAFHPEAKALIKFERQAGPGSGAVNGGLFLEGLCTWTGGGAGKGQWWIESFMPEPWVVGPMQGSDRAIDIAGQHVISATENGCIRAGTSTAFQFSYASITRYGLSRTGPWWTPNGYGAVVAPTGIYRMVN